MTDWRIEIDYACGLVSTDNGKVVEAAPIFKWAIGKHIFRVASWVSDKGGTMRELERAGP